MARKKSLLRSSRLLWTLFIFPFLIELSFAANKEKTVSIDLYVMSLCPFGVQAENVIIPSVKSLNGRADLNLHFIAGEVAVSTQAPLGFRSLHGQGEVEEDIRQLCVRQYFPKLYLDYILERNKDYRNTDWKNVANKMGLEINKIDACATGQEGKSLLHENIKASQDQRIFGSPTIFIDGKPYNGARGQRSITLAACQMMKEKGISQPNGCKKAEAMPPDTVPSGTASDTCGEQTGPPFEIRVVVDTSCAACSPTLIDTLKKLHPNAVIKTVGMDSLEGRALIKEHQTKTLPLYVLDKKVESDPNFMTLIDSYYAKSGDGYIVKSGTNTYLPNFQIGRQLTPHHADIFIEALSPDSVKAESEFVDFLKQTTSNDLTFSFHYIVQEGVNADVKSRSIPMASDKKVRVATGRELASTLPGPIVSRLGENNVRESLRQVCLFQKAPIGAFFSYLACRSQNLQDDTMADKCLVLDDSIKTCIDGGEGEDLLRQDARLVQELGITPGVYILWENRFGPFNWNEIDWRKIIVN